MTGFFDFNKKKRKVVYTAIIGKYDKLLEPKVISEGFDYVCFTDDEKLKSKVWKIRVVDNPQGLDSSRLARKIKILCSSFLKEYDMSIWVDGNLTINCNLNNFLDDHYHGEDIVVLRHPDRSCVYEELEACIKLDKDDEELMKQQVEGYRSEGYPERNGLVANTLMIRNHNSKRVEEFMNRWWKEVCFKSKRDQLSFNFVLWKYPLSIEYCDWNHTITPDFSRGNHEIRKIHKKQLKKKKWLSRFSFIKNF